MLYIFNEPSLDENGNILSNDLNEIMLWVFTATSGFFYSTIFGAGVSWTAEFVDVTRGYAFVFGLGNQCGQFLLPIAGSLVLKDPSLWMLVATLYCSLSIVFGVVLTFGGAFLKKINAK